jgi:hypothetical protein
MPKWVEVILSLLIFAVGAVLLYATFMSVVSYMIKHDNNRFNVWRP